MRKGKSSMNRNVLALLGSTMLLTVTAVADDPAKIEAPTTNAPAASQPAPKIQFDKTVYDFGNTSMVQQLTGTFTFENTGVGVLELKKPTTSCGCTVASVKPETLRPEEHTSELQSR